MASLSLRGPQNSLKLLVLMAAISLFVTLLVLLRSSAPGLSFRGRGIEEAVFPSTTFEAFTSTPFQDEALSVMQPQEVQCHTGWSLLGVPRASWHGPFVYQPGATPVSGEVGPRVLLLQKGDYADRLLRGADAAFGASHADIVRVCNVDRKVHTSGQTPKYPLISVAPALLDSCSFTARDTRRLLRAIPEDQVNAALVTLLFNFVDGLSALHLKSLRVTRIVLADSFVFHPKTLSVVLNDLAILGESNERDTIGPFEVLKRYIQGDLPLSMTDYGGMLLEVLPSLKPIVGFISAANPSTPEEITDAFNTVKQLLRNIGVSPYSPFDFRHQLEKDAGIPLSGALGCSRPPLLIPNENWFSEPVKQQYKAFEQTAAAGSQNVVVPLNFTFDASATSPPSSERKYNGHLVPWIDCDAMHRIRTGKQLERIQYKFLRKGVVPGTFTLADGTEVPLILKITQADPIALFEANNHRVVHGGAGVPKWFGFCESGTTITYIVEAVGDHKASKSKVLSLIEKSPLPNQIAAAQFLHNWVSLFRDITERQAMFIQDLSTEQFRVSDDLRVWFVDYDNAVVDPSRYVQRGTDFGRRVCESDSDCRPRFRHDMHFSPEAQGTCHNNYCMEQDFACNVYSFAHATTRDWGVDFGDALAQYIPQLKEVQPKLLANRENRMHFSQLLQRLPEWVPSYLSPQPPRRLQDFYDLSSSSPPAGKQPTTATTTPNTITYMKGVYNIPAQADRTYNGHEVPWVTCENFDDLVTIGEQLSRSSAGRIRKRIFLGTLKHGKVEVPVLLKASVPDVVTRLVLNNFSRAQSHPGVVKWYGFCLNDQVSVFVVGKAGPIKASRKNVEAIIQASVNPKVAALTFLRNWFSLFEHLSEQRNIIVPDLSTEQFHIDINLNVWLVDYDNSIQDLTDQKQLPRSFGTRPCQHDADCKSRYRMDMHFAPEVQKCENSVCLEQDYRSHVFTFATKRGSPWAVDWVPRLQQYAPEVSEIMGRMLEPDMNKRIKFSELVQWVDRKLAALPKVNKLLEQDREKRQKHLRNGYMTRMLSQKASQLMSRVMPKTGAQGTPDSPPWITCDNFNLITNIVKLASDNVKNRPKTVEEGQLALPGGGSVTVVLKKTGIDLFVLQTLMNLRELQSHPSIVSFYGYCSTDTDITFVMGLAPGEKLSKARLKALLRTSTDPRADALKFLKNLVSAFYHLESKGFVIPDLYGDQFHLDDEFNVYLVDYDNSILNTKQKNQLPETWGKRSCSTSDDCGSRLRIILHLSPESYGLCNNQVCAELTPQSHVFTLAQENRNSWSMDFFLTCQEYIPELKVIRLRMLEPVPNQRPRFQQLLAWLKDIEDGTFSEARLPALVGAPKGFHVRETDPNSRPTVAERTFPSYRLVLRDKATDMAVKEDALLDSLIEKSK